jgi:hypothetical protein
MRLKGKVLERLSPEKREKMERTLKRMEDSRRKDDMKLRELINNKREWAVAERQKGFNIIKKYDEQIAQIEEEKNKVKGQIKTIDGCLLVLDDLILEIKKMDEEDRKAQQEAIERAKVQKAQKEQEVETEKKVKKPKKKKSV